MEYAPPKKTTISLLAELSNGDAWNLIRAENLALNATPESQSNRAEVEMTAFASTSYALHDAEFLGSPITIIGFGRTAVDSTLRLISASGRYQPITSMPCGDTLAEIDKVLDPEGDVLALCVVAGPKRHPEEYYFPLHTETLAHIEAEIVDNAEPQSIRLLKSAAKQVTKYLKSREFLDTTREEQIKQVEQLENDLNDVVVQMAEFESVVIYCDGYTRIIENDGFYQSERSPFNKKSVIDLTPLHPQVSGDELVENPYCCVMGNSIRITIPKLNAGWGDTPMLELSNPEAETKYLIRPAALRDAIFDAPGLFDADETNEFGQDKDPKTTIDLLGEYFNDEWHEHARELITSLTYDKQYVSEVEWNERYLDAIEELEQGLPDWDYGEIRVLGIINHLDRPEVVDEKYSFEGIDIVEINNIYIPVAWLTKYDAETGDEVRVYVEPHRDKLLNFEMHLFDEENEITDLITVLHNEAQAATEIVNMSDFYLLPLDEQQKMLSVSAEAVFDHLGVFSDFFADCQIDIRVSAYRKLPVELLEIVGWSDVAVNDRDEDAGGLTSIIVDEISVYNPEVDDTTRQSPFSSIDDFPLSGGEPMLVFDNKTEGMFYLVKVRDIAALAPIVSN